VLNKEATLNTKNEIQANGFFSRTMRTLTTPVYPETHPELRRKNGISGGIPIPELILI
jgi:hypothetical protein